MIAPAPARVANLFIVAALMTATGGLAAVALPRDALRATVEMCAAVAAATSLPVPCTRLEEQGGFQMAILDPPILGTHRLVVPVTPTLGIEAPTLAGPAGAAVFAVAWRTALGQAGGRWGWAGLAVNSAQVRSQDQLHIHVDCLAPAGRAALQRLQVGKGWQRLGRDWVLGLAAEDARKNPFELLRQVPAFAGHMASVNLGVFGRGTPAQGWLVMANAGRRSYERWLTTGCSG